MKSLRNDANAKKAAPLFLNAGISVIKWDLKNTTSDHCTSQLEENYVRRIPTISIGTSSLLFGDSPYFFHSLSKYCQNHSVNITIQVNINIYIRRLVFLGKAISLTPFIHFTNPVRVSANCAWKIHFYPSVKRGVRWGVCTASNGSGFSKFKVLLSPLEIQFKLFPVFLPIWEYSFYYWNRIL